MERERPTDDFRWMWTARPRRLGIGDLMFLVVMAALGSYLIVLVRRSRLNEVVGAVGVFYFGTFVLFGMQIAQWLLGGASAVDLSSTREAVRGISAYVLSMTMFILICAIAAMYPAGAAVIVVAMIALALYLSSWE